eukprot:4854735-Lingulodinium_polyedra.AAC.1
MGLEEADHWRLLAVMDAEEFAVNVKELKVEGQPPAPAQRAKMALVGRAARARGGTLVTIDAIKKTYEAKLAEAFAAKSAASTTSASEVKLSAVINQVSEASVPMLSNEDVTRAYARYKGIFKRFPRADEELSVHQMAAFSHLIGTGVA